MVDISIIVPIYNCSSNLKNLVNALKSQDIDQEVEVVFVDNNSTDNSFEVAQTFSQLTNFIITNQSKIQSVAATRNKGINLAKGDILAFIDGDCIPAVDWLKQGIQCMQNNQVQRVGGRIKIAALNAQSSTYSLVEALFCYDQESAVKGVGACMTPNLFVQQDVFKKVGVFDETFPGASIEDMEFGMRATQLGVSLAYAEDAVVWHPSRDGFRQMWKRVQRDGKGQFLLCEKNSEWRGFLGWKHPLRCIKMILSLRYPNWTLLPFPHQELSFSTRFLIYIISFFLFNLGEPYGYFASWIASFFQKN